MTGAGGHDAQGASSRDHGGNSISALEWLVAAFGLLLVSAVVAFMVFDTIRGSGEPPHVRVRADSVVALGEDTYLVQFTAENRGRATAANVIVAGELRDATGAEMSRARLDYVPGRSERHGGLYFQRDPRPAALRLWAEGYQEP